MHKRKINQLENEPEILGDEIDELVPILPHRVKEWEKDRINPLYMNVHEFPPQRLPLNQVFLWVYTENEELILGVEHPEKCDASLFGFDRDTWEKLKKSLATVDKNEGIGHPTLSANFDAQGNAHPEQGKALLGGTLEYSHAKKAWVVSNVSGRFGRYDVKDENTIELSKTILEKVKTILADKVIHARENRPILTIFTVKEKKGKQKVDSHQVNNVPGAKKRKT